MLFKRNKFKKISRKEVVDKIIEFENERVDIENDIINNEKEVKELFKKGSLETSEQIKMVYANKIKRLRVDNSRKNKKLKYLNYNINVLEQLKLAIEDNEFAKNKNNDNLNKILGDTKSLTEFLEKVSINKIKMEENLVNANELFDTMNSVNEGFSEIYEDDVDEMEIFAQFELAKDMYSKEQKTEKETQNKEEN